MNPQEKTALVEQFYEKSFNFFGSRGKVVHLSDAISIIQNWGVGEGHLVELPHDAVIDTWEAASNNGTIGIYDVNQVVKKLFILYRNTMKQDSIAQPTPPDTLREALELALKEPDQYNGDFSAFDAAHREIERQCKASENGRFTSANDIVTAAIKAWQKPIREALKAHSLTPSTYTRPNVDKTEENVHSQSVEKQDE